MPVPIPEELMNDVREEITEPGVAVSIADTLRARQARDRLRGVVDWLEEEYGPVTEEEQAAARAGMAAIRAEHARRRRLGNGRMTGGRPACQTGGMTAHPLRLTVAITREDEWYVARCLQVEVTSQGETIEEALANLREALELSFEDAPVPDVTDVITAPVDVRVA